MKTVSHLLSALADSAFVKRLPRSVREEVAKNGLATEAGAKSIAQILRCESIATMRLSALNAHNRRRVVAHLRGCQAPVEVVTLVARTFDLLCAIHGVMRERCPRPGERPARMPPLLTVVFLRTKTRR